MAREIHDIRQSPPKPESITGYTEWTASRESYKLTAIGGYYKSGEYVSATLTLTVTLYAWVQEPGADPVEREVCQFNMALPRQSLGFLGNVATGGFWETIDAVKHDYEDIHARAVTWFAEKFDHEFPR